MQQSQFTCFNLGLFFNNDGVSSLANPLDGNFDTVANVSGSTYPAEKLPVPNSIQPVGNAQGLLVAWPDFKDGYLNNISCAGQVLKGFQKQRFDRLYFIGSSVLGDQQGTVKLMYHNGMVQEFKIQMNDWCKQPDIFKDCVAAQSPIRRNHIGAPEEQPCYIWAVPLKAKGELFLEAIRLPENGNIHIFGISGRLPQ